MIVKLFGYHDASLTLEGASPQTVRLKPVVPLLVPWMYTVRDYPGFYGVGILLLAGGLRVRAYRRAGRTRPGPRLDLGVLKEGVWLGAYRLGPELGAGGMARVFRAQTEEGSTEPLALKVLRLARARDPASRKRWAREVQILCKLRHPNLVFLRDWGQEGEFLYLVMELVTGETLAQKLEREGPADLDRLLDWSVQICRGLEHIHRLGVVHRDLKPANLILTPEGRVRILDLGIATYCETHAALEAVGTPAYASPEQIRSDPVDWRSDYYSLGVLMYEALTGRLPFASPDPREVLRAHLTQTPEPAQRFRSDCPAALDALLGRMLSKRPHQRFQDLDECLRALERLRGAL